MRNIDWDKALSDEDREWLEQRMTPALAEKIDENDRRFGKDTQSADTDKAPAFEDTYDKWKIDELRAEAEGREPVIDTSGMTKKADFIAALRTWDAEHPDAIEVP